MGNRWDGIPADLFVDILQRLPPCPRRRLRLVCRHWRDVIDDRTPEPPARAKVLAFVSRDHRCHAFVFDELPKARAGGRFLKLRGGVGSSGSIMVGTCNGLLCLRRRHGDVVIVNPATGEKLAIPPPPSETTARADSYSFAYHPATGFYKVVHVPCADGDSGGAFYAVNVFTLGDASWHEVPVLCGSSWLLSFGLVSIHGAVYWVSKDACSVMSLDLSDERLAFVATLPQVRPGTDISWHLTADARGRLGFAVCSYDQKDSKCKTEVWMLEAGGRHGMGNWVLRCKIEDPGRNPLQQVASPLAIHGEHVLVTTPVTGRPSSLHLHAHSLSEAKTHGAVVPMECTPSSPWISPYGNMDGIRTFAYVETKEPLALYAFVDGKIGEDEEWSWVLDSSKTRWTLVPQSWWFPYNPHVS
ncbi:unnamed protein product [Urochloa humidicola]